MIEHYAENVVLRRGTDMLESLLRHEVFCRDDVLLHESEATAVVRSVDADTQGAKPVPCANLGIAAVTLVSQTHQSEEDRVSVEADHFSHDVYHDLLEQEFDDDGYDGWDNDDEVACRTIERKARKEGAAHAAALLRDLQHTLAVIGNKLSSRDKLPQLLRGTGMKSLAAMAKKEFGGAR